MAGCGLPLVWHRAVHKHSWLAQVPSVLRASRKLPKGTKAPPEPSEALETIASAHGVFAQASEPLVSYFTPRKHSYSLQNRPGSFSSVQRKTCYFNLRVYLFIAVELSRHVTCTLHLGVGATSTKCHFCAVFSTEHSLKSHLAVSSIMAEPRSCIIFSLRPHKIKSSGFFCFCV